MTHANAPNIEIPEGFRIIPGYQWYIINNDGSIVRRLQKPNGPIVRTSTIKHSFHPDKGKQFPHGYWYVALLQRDTPDQQDETGLWPRGVHTLVAAAWCVKPQYAGELWVNHEDGNKINNHYTNLKWESIAYNIQHAHDSGLVNQKRGKDHHRYGTTVPDDVRKRQSLAKLGERHPKFKGYYLTPAGRFDSAQAAANANGILNGKTLINRCKSPKWWNIDGQTWGFEAITQP